MILIRTTPSYPFLMTEKVQLKLLIHLDVILTCYNHPSFIKLFAITPEESGQILNGRIRFVKLDWNQGFILIATQTRIFVYSFVSLAAIKKDYPSKWADFWKNKFKITNKAEEIVYEVDEPEVNEVEPALEESKDLDDLMNQLVFLFLFDCLGSCCR
jgi:hypothetical protein